MIINEKYHGWNENRHALEKVDRVTSEGIFLFNGESEHSGSLCMQEIFHAVDGPMCEKVTYRQLELEERFCTEQNAGECSVLEQCQLTEYTYHLGFG